MANDCLVINLESEIDDPALPVLGALEFEIHFIGSGVTQEISSFQMGALGEGCEIEILDNGNFYSGYLGTVIGKTVTKTGTYNQDRIFIKPDIFTQPIKIRVRNAFANLLSFGNPAGDWAPNNGLFITSTSENSIGWRLFLPKEIQYCQNITGIGVGCVQLNLDLVDYTQLSSLRTLIMNHGIYFSNNQALNIVIPESLERLSLASNVLNSPVGDRGIIFDIFRLKGFVTLNIGGATTTPIYTGDGSMLSTLAIGVFTQNSPFEASNTAQFDLYLQALSLCTFYGSGNIRVAGTRTSASDSAVATLVSKLPGRFYINGTLQS